MRILLIHQNFPGQFGHLAKAWSCRPNWELRALGRDAAPGLAGFEALMRYRLPRASARLQHPYLRKMESAVLHGQAAARAMLQMKRSGFTPDVVVGHPGWGETLFVKDVFPDVRLIHLCEWYYAAQGADVGFDPEFPSTLDDHARIRSWNALHALNLTHCDAAISPTQWQRSRHPSGFLDKIMVQHEGIPVGRLCADDAATIRLPNGRVLRAGDPVVTYVARNLEPYRGFHIFMRALERIQRANRRIEAVVVGGDGVSYGAASKDGQTWREKMLAETCIDLERTHFVGRVPHPAYVRLLQVSAAHVYLTYPFVLSWSALEAMACSALVIGSDTAPVREVISDGENGLLVPFFDVEAIADTVCAAIDDPKRFAGVRKHARDSVQGLSHEAGLVGYETMLC